MRKLGLQDSRTNTGHDAPAIVADEAMWHSRDDHDKYLDVLEITKPVGSQVADGASPEFHPDKLA
ncbi:DDT domain-containing protein PTM-like isoform X1 [Gossypium australe]|uniref:DDT domain-containing protein PTM-like isoform X1 n=1 Tax=Gossypium australe TaxID=47621 RepID=A0A5B6ULJ0_9ROSI|nr:DDT domain-containing protein PTM-like isoform X1 [Gossypium australe]